MKHLTSHVFDIFVPKVPTTEFSSKLMWYIKSQPHWNVLSSVKEYPLCIVRVLPMKKSNTSFWHLINTEYGLLAESVRSDGSREKCTLTRRTVIMISNQRRISNNLILYSPLYHRSLVPNHPKKNTEEWVV